MWDIAKETVLTTMPPPVFASLEPKLMEYRGGYGTVSRLAFEGSILAVIFVRSALFLDTLLIFVEAGRVQAPSLLEAVADGQDRSCSWKTPSLKSSSRHSFRISCPRTVIVGLNPLPLYSSY